MPRTDDLRIREMKELTPPAHLIREFPVTPAAEQTASRRAWRCTASCTARTTA
jgi:3-deoxy-7-phosphoheptulonate synthase